MLRVFLTASLFVMATLLAACATNVRANPVDQEPAGVSRAASVTETAHAENIPSEPPADCPTTVPHDPPFVPPSPYDQLGFEGEFWYGSSSLWTTVPRDGTWDGLAHNPGGYTQKIFWWREGYSTSEEPEPALIVTAERLDDKAPLITGLKATNASAGDTGSAMLVGLDLPAPGCWKVTGKYGNEELSFVVWVAE
jgi:hypothetical protein